MSFVTPVAVTIDTEAGAFYVYTKEPGTPVARTVEISATVNADYDSSGELVGIEVLTGLTSNSSCHAEDLGPSTIVTRRK